MRINLNKFIRYYRLNYYCTKSSKSDLKWESVVGLEIHAQINTESKLFSASSTLFGSLINNNVSLFDAAIPGTLPVLNKKCVEMGILTALALNCEIKEISEFDRKHYFYADLPAGYQITQQRKPLATNGEINFPVFYHETGKKFRRKNSKIKQIQLEQDSGKSLHDEISQRSLIDLNRAGNPLMEIVFEPDISDGEEAAALVKELTLILTRLNTCTCKMEEGILRVDANVSVRKKYDDNLGVRTEIKNIGSIRGVAKAINYEIKRQIELLDSNKKILKETRAWDADLNATLSMRSKEIAQDYRFMPEPNLLPLKINLTNKISKDLINVNQIKEKLPELPEKTRQMLINQYKLSNDFSINLVNEDKLLIRFLEVMKEKPTRNPKIVAKILLMDLLTLVNNNIIDINDKTKISNIKLGQIIDLLQFNDITAITSRRLLEEISLNENSCPLKIITERNWKQIKDPDELLKLCQEAIRQNPNLLKKYKAGKTKVFTALLGVIAKNSDNRANMELTTKILKEVIQKE